METGVEAPISVEIVEGPLGPGEAPAPAEGAGAVLAFEGIVRPMEGEAEIGALEYEAYRPMAEMQLRRVAEDVVERHELIALHAAHSTGRVPVGACSFRLHVAAEHRGEALAGLAEFVDRLKRDVPIWKAPVSA